MFGTVKMKTPIEYDVQDLKREYNKLNPAKYPSISTFCQAIAETEWAKNLNKGKGVSFAWVKQKLELAKLNPTFTSVPRVHFGGKRPEKTPGVKKGRGANQERRNWAKSISPHFKGDREKKLVKKIEEGSLKAAVNLKCIECCCGDTTFIKDCKIKTCPLWFDRPYQNKGSEDVSDELC